MPEDPRAVVKQLMRAASVSALTMIGCVCLGAGVGWVMERVAPAQGWGLVGGVLAGVLVGFYQLYKQVVRLGQ
ncbi:AtpZ/AtpI family protein [Candidatus Marinamargulisbacteria bacterium]|jgi:F0F1-type ATP synthase assembly protein I|nr:AtpZ/AtpI family protein [Candidatus Marinamargulisbacteria bacterium]